MKRRMSRIQALRKLIDRVNKLDKNIRAVACLATASIIISLVSIIFAINASLSCV